MKRKFNYLLSFVIIFLTIESIVGQNVKKEEDLFKLPENYCLAVNVIQNKSPIQFEAIDIVVERNGKTPFLNWKLKNNSSKTVRRFVVAFKIRTNIEQWRVFAERPIIYDIGTDEKNDLILPYKNYQETNYEINFPLPQEIHNLFSSKNKSEDAKFAVVYGMIKKVVFNDGSIYEENNKIFGEFLY